MAPPTIRIVVIRGARTPHLIVITPSKNPPTDLNPKRSAMISPENSLGSLPIASRV